MFRQDITATLQEFCKAVVDGNTACLIGMLTDEGATQVVGAMSESFSGERHGYCKILSKENAAGTHTVIFEIGASSHRHVLETRWVCRENRWVIDGTKQLNSRLT